MQIEGNIHPAPGLNGIANWTCLSIYACAISVQFGVWSQLPELTEKISMKSDVAMALDLLSGLEGRWVRAGKYRFVSTFDWDTIVVDMGQSSTARDLVQGLVSIEPSKDLEAAAALHCRVFTARTSFVAADTGDYLQPRETLERGSSVHINSSHIPGVPAQFDIWNPPTSAQEYVACFPIPVLRLY